MGDGRKGCKYYLKLRIRTHYQTSTSIYRIPFNETGGKKINHYYCGGEGWGGAEDRYLISTPAMNLSPFSERSWISHSNASSRIICFFNANCALVVVYID